MSPSPDQPQVYEEGMEELTPEQIQESRVYDAKTRADYRVKFSILREAYPQMDIPEPDEAKSIPEIEAEYKEYVKRILIDSSVEQNKVYLLILWLVIELAGARLMRLPFSGYTMNQFKYMNKYQMLLIELGESAASAGVGSGWPVEVRILALALFNGVIFILVKMLADKVGDGMAEQLSELISNFLTENRGADVLKRAEQASADNPPPPSAASAQDATPPLGGLGSMIAQFASSFMGGNSGGGGGTSAPEEKPQVRRPTTFASRRRRGNRNNT